MDGEAVVDGAGFQAGQRHDRLERRARRLLRLNGAVQQRVVRVVGDFLPVLGLDADGEFVGIEGRPADHGQHLAGARIERHHRAVLAVHGQLGHGLQIQIDGELQILAGHGRLVLQHLAHLAAIVHHHLALAVHAHQRVVVLALDAELADHGPGIVLGELRIVQFLLADFTGVADDVRHHAVLRIEPSLRLNHDQLGKEIAVRIDECQVGGRELFLEHDGLVLGPGAEAADLGPEVVVIQVEPLGDGLEVLLFQRLAGQDQSEGRVVVDDHAAVAVENAAARRQNGHALDAVGLRALVVKLRILHLQLPEAGDQKQEDDDGGVLKDGDFPGGARGDRRAKVAYWTVRCSRFGSTGRITTVKRKLRPRAPLYLSRHSPGASDSKSGVSARRGR